MGIHNAKHEAKCGDDPGSPALSLVSVVAAVMLASPAVAWAQAAEWTVYNTSNSGLPYNGVTGLATDTQGNLWVGTGRWYAWAGGGLAKFDGENWTVYNTANSGLPNNDHTGLAIDPQGNIWCGTEGGFGVFDGEHWTTYHTGNSGLPHNLVASPSFDAQGNMWAGTWGGGLAKFDGSSWTVYNISNSGLPHNQPWTTLIDAEDNVWLGTVGGNIVKFDGVNWTIYNAGNSGLSLNAIADISFDREGNLWVAGNGPAGRALVKFDGENWTVYAPDDSSLPNNEIWDLAIDAQDNKWIATLGGGLVRFDGENWTVYTTSNSGLPDNRLYRLLIDDATGRIWIGTENAGLVVFCPRPVLDFNGDGTVDIKDLLRLIESWGINDPLCDIGPTAFGDGIVDEADLEVLMSHWGQEVEDSSLIAHWRFDEIEGIIASDSAGDHDGTVIGVPAWQPTGGKVDGALEFNGTTFVVTDSVLNPSEGPLSVLAWVKDGAPGQVIVSQQAGANWLMADALQGSLATELKGNSRLSTALSSETIITDGNWHRLGFAWDGSVRHLYVDSILVAEDTETALAEGHGGLSIGADKNLTAGTFFSGLIDDIRIYSRAIKP